ILIAVAFFYNDEVNYDSLEEMDDSYSAVHATNVVSENFDEGQLFPVEVIISNGGDLLTPESLSRLEAVASTLDNIDGRSEEHTSELQSRFDLVCRLLLEKQTTHAVQNGTKQKMIRISGRRIRNNFNHLN